MKIDIMRALVERPQRSTPLAGLTNMNHATCTALLREMVRQGLVTQVEKSYHATEKGKQVFKIIDGFREDKEQ